MSRPSPRITLRIDLDDDRAIGPGKIRLLELIDEFGSISGAGRRMNMSYRRAWLLVDNLNQCFRQPLVVSQAGGAHGGGAELTEFGRRIVAHYRSAEATAYGSAAADIAALAAAASETPLGSSSRTVGGRRRGRKSALPVEDDVAQTLEDGGRRS